MSGRPCPPELTDRMIDCLQDDLPCLRTCALVCHAWLPRCRYHIFRHIRISSNATLHKLAELSHDPGIRTHFGLLRSLHLVEDSTMLHPGGSPFVHTVPVVLSDVVSLVETMMISAVNWMKLIPRNELLHACTRFSSLESLVLDHCVFHSFRDVQRILCALPVLSKLKVARMTQWVSVGDARTIREKERPRLTTLEIADCWEKETGDLFEWLLGTPSRETLSTLKLSTSLKVDELQTFISGLGPSLQTLEMHFQGGLRVLGMLNINDCAALRSLRIGYHPSSLGSPDLPAFATFLSGTFCSLSNIHLDIRFRTTYCQHVITGDWPWSLLDKALASAQFRSLRVFVLHFHQLSCTVDMPPVHHEICEDLASQLPDLIRRDILQVCSERWQEELV